MRRCFHCGKATPGEALIAVGDGEFCQACFAALLLAEEAPVEGSKQREAATPAPPRARAAGLPVAARATCLVCERELLGAAAIQFLGGQLCGACNAEMAAELQSATSEASSPVMAALSPVPAGATGEVFTPGAGTRACAGCERPMPGPGSYRMIRGGAYCSACWPFYASGHADVTQRPASAAAMSCDCCRRSLSPDAELHQGFLLCGACLASDVDLALRIARARHRHELARLRSALENDS